MQNTNAPPGSSQTAYFPPILPDASTTWTLEEMQGTAAKPDVCARGCLELMFKYLLKQYQGAVNDLQDLNNVNTHLRYTLDVKVKDLEDKAAQVIKFIESSRKPKPASRKRKVAARVIKTARKVSRR